MSSTRVLRRLWAVALVALLVSSGAAPAQTKPSVAAAEEMSRSTVLGDVVTLEILRVGRADHFPVAVTERRDLSGLSDAVDAREHMVPRLGILGLNLTDRIRHMLSAVRFATGVVVASTVPGAIDSRDGGFAPGDVIYAINRVPVSGLGQLRALLETLRIGDPIVVQLQRRGELMYLAFALE